MFRLNKGSIYGDIESLVNEIKAFVALLSWFITQKQTFNNTRIKFGALVLMEMNKNHTAKHTWWEQQHYG
jgi:hypothetical protein